jgi:peptide/nickel transport system substrate-binding protein
MLTRKRTVLVGVSLLATLALLVGCATPTPEVVEKVVEKVVTQVVKETVIVEGTPQIVEQVVTATPVTGPQKGGTIVIGLSGDPESLDPADHRSRLSETIIRNMFDGLVTRTHDGRVVLQLAESATLVDDSTWEFVLKKGVTFHNGEDLTAEDVKFTFDRIISENGIDYPEPHTSPRKGLISPLESVEIVDEYTVRLHLSAPWPVAMQMFVHQQIVPKDYFEEVGNEGFIKHLVGSGPFKFVEGSSDQVVMERFDDYYGGADELPPVGPPSLDRVIFKVLPESSTRVAALRTGEVNIIQSVPSHMIPLLATDPNVRIGTGPSTSPQWMEMNVNKPPFDDVRVRQAMNYAVDAETLVETVLGGLGIVIPGPLSPFNNFADHSLEPYGYDPDKALELLAEAGWTDSDGDGFLDMGGEKFAFVIDVRPGSSKDWGEAVAGQLLELGIDASLRLWGDYSVLKPLMMDGERTAYVGGWGDSAFDPVGHFEAKWHSQVEGTGNGRGNFSTYSNPRVDELIEAGEVEPDVEKRHEIYNEAQQIVYEEAPAVFLFLPDTIEGCTVNVQNWKVASDGRQNMHDVWLSE